LLTDSPYTIWRLKVDWRRARRGNSAFSLEDAGMATVTIQEAQAKLPDLIRKLAPGDEVVITENCQPIAKLISQSQAARKPRQRGSAKGRLVIHAEDDEHLEHFKEYVP
jgi:prevent-host-death family protein